MGINRTTTSLSLIFGCRSLCDRAPGSPSPLILTDDTCQPLLIRDHMETSNDDETQATVYVCPQSVWVWVRKLFAESLFQVELSSSKSLARSPPKFFPGPSRSTSFSTRFLVPKAFPLPLDNYPCFCRIFPLDLRRKNAIRHSLRSLRRNSK